MRSTSTSTRVPALAARRRDVSPARLDLLFARWQREEDAAAREALVQQFLPLVRSLARRYAASAEPFEDLVQVGSLALIKAIDRFDPGRGPSFVGYAIPTILGELRRYFRDGTWSVHVARGAKERALAVAEAMDVLTERHGRAPSAQQLAEYLEVSLEDAVDGLLAGMAYDARSLDAPGLDAGDDADAFGATLGTEDGGYALVEDRMVLAQILPVLSERERCLLHMRFIEELTQSEIAARLAVSQMQVSRLLRRSLERLRRLGG